MPYTPEMKKLIEVVEKTRPARLQKARDGKEFPAKNQQERDEVLKKFHPDYKPEGRREVRVGPNKGDGKTYPDEVARLLEAKSRLDPDLVDVSAVWKETEVLVLGGGGSAASAALMAAKNGAKVLMVTKLRFGDANTVMAEGGIQGADQEGDSPYFHYLDIVGGGHFTNDPKLASALAHDAPLVLEWLEKMGMMYDKLPDGRMVVRHGGGTSRKRMHSAADITGAEIMRVLRDEVRNQVGKVEIVEFSPAVELILDKDKRIWGAVLFNLETEEYLVVKAKAVVLATGGFGRLHIQGFPTTNHYGATMDGCVMAYRCGIPTRFLYSVQYHPTGAIYPDPLIGILITEKVRGLGANVLNVHGEQFVFEREPRDVEAASIIQECVERGNGIPTPTGNLGIWLDSPMIDMLLGPGTVDKALPGKSILYRRHGIDISKEPILIYPTLHYQNGGIEIDENGTTRVEGLYGAGEVVGGIHGENRLMGNSLLDITVFGRRAGTAAAAYAKKRTGFADPSLDHVRAFNEEVDEAKIEDGTVAPMLLPNYTNAEVRDRQWTARYIGTLR